MRRHRRPFTLIEVMVVIGLVALVISVFGVMGYRLVSHERFVSDSDLAVDQLRLAQNLMLILDADATFEIHKDSETGVYGCRVNTDKPLPKGFSRFVNQAYSLTGIPVITFAQDRGFPQAISEVRIRFFSQGSLMDDGTLRFQKEAQESTDDTVVELAGFPGKIKTGGAAPRFDAVQESIRWYPEEILSFSRSSNSHLPDRVDDNAPPDAPGEDL